MKAKHAKLERLALQIVVGVAALIPVYAGIRGIISGIPGASDTSFALRTAQDGIDSHYVYMSGMLLAVGVWLWACIPKIEKRVRRMEILLSIVFVGGICRMIRLLAAGTVDDSAFFALSMELIVAPLVYVWQRRVAEQYKVKA